MAEACAQWYYESRVKMVGGRSTTPERGFLDADGLISLDLSGLYIVFYCSETTSKWLKVVIKLFYKPLFEWLLK